MSTFQAMLPGLALIPLTNTAWKLSKYRGFSGPYFHVFGLNKERYYVSLPIQFECMREIWTQKFRIWTLFTQCLHLLTRLKPRFNWKDRQKFIQSSTALCWVIHVSPYPFCYEQMILTDEFSKEYLQNRSAFVTPGVE